MELETEWIAYRSSGEPVKAYLARPAAAAGSLPAIVVIQEVWGVDAHIEDVTRRFATAGYLALAPDLYSHGGARPEALAPERVEAAKVFLGTLPIAAWMNPAERDAALDQRPEPERTLLGETMAKLLDPNRPTERYLGDLRAAVSFVRGHPASPGQRVGSVGFCMGGGLSALLACVEPHVSAAVAFYGMPPTADRLGSLRAPILGLFGGDDPRITGAVPGFAEAMRAAGKALESRIYPGVPHAFFNDTRPSYRVAAARDAWALTLGFFARHLCV